jgi:hypothetical protein
MIKAWHFLRADGLTQYSGERVVVGETLRVDGRIKLCERGLHASVRAIDALQYAPGPICCRVRMGGEIIHDDDKLVASERTALWMFDATNVLHEMACISATTALLIEEVNDPRCWAAIEAKRAWLRGELDDAGLAAARAAAWSAAKAAAWDAAGAAAREAAKGAAWAAARAAARYGAWHAAWHAAGDSARAAAWDAARYAARDEQNQVLEMLLTEAGAK